MAQRESLITRMLHTMFPTVPAELRVLMVSLDAAGKTTCARDCVRIYSLISLCRSILYHMKLGEVVCTIPTIGFNVETIMCV
jgi:hypothetical protein